MPKKSRDISTSSDKSPAAKRHRANNKERRQDSDDERLPGPSTSRPAPDPTTGINLNATHGRGALGLYISKPQDFPSPMRVLYHTPDFVVIRDLYPKSQVHLLILPRNKSKTLQHPFEALKDEKFLALVRTEAQKVVPLVASELRRLHCTVSASEKARNAALDSDDPPEELPAGRDWAKEVRVGVHAQPSMDHLHIHVMSADRSSESLRHRKHYNSFSTPFFVPLEDFPLDENDKRRHPSREGYIERDLRCWRCGKDFGRGFKKLKEHLAEELESWRRE